MVDDSFRRSQIPAGWFSDKRSAAVSFASPNELVRVALPGPVATTEPIEVFLLADGFIRPWLQQHGKWLHNPEIVLTADPSATVAAGQGVLSTAWPAREARLGPATSRYVARTTAFGLSTRLAVAAQIAWGETSPALKLEPEIKAGLPGVGGAKLAVGIDSGQRQLSGIAFAPVDPGVEFRLIAPDISGPVFTDYLSDYLRDISEEFDVDARDLVSWAWDRYGEHLANTAGLGAETRPSEVDLGPGERAEVTVDLYPNSAGKVIGAIAAIERGAEELLAVSEIVALSVNEDGEIHREA